MFKVLVEILDENGLVEETKICEIEAEDMLGVVDSVDEITEDDIDCYLDLCCESQPAYFANSSGKVNYSFKLLNSEDVDEYEKRYEENATEIDFCDATIDESIETKQVNISLSLTVPKSMNIHGCNEFLKTLFNEFLKDENFMYNDCFFDETNPEVFDRIAHSFHINSIIEA